MKKQFANSWPSATLFRFIFLSVLAPRKNSFFYSVVVIRAFMSTCFSSFLLFFLLCLFTASVWQKFLIILTKMPTVFSILSVSSELFPSTSRLAHSYFPLIACFFLLVLYSFLIIPQLSSSIPLPSLTNSSQAYSHCTSMKSVEKSWD